ncbi:MULTISPECIES: Na+/H+ antiporter [unclassified Haladaptatus]|uniref:Na+/H+ antiporter n=1 Tax=unclassified Haladaptatus TaxID=2622732 RepID=UPI0023E8CD81|nr:MULTISPECIES: Na+/H+ antiporter [unclassified Haladaptatus]
MTATGVESSLLSLLAVFILAAGVGIFVAKVGRFPYTIALLLAGLAVSILGVEVGLELSHDLILLVLLPPLLFEGAATTDLERFRANIVPILVLAIPGLIVSVLILGYIGQFAFGFPLLIALLFAATILPTDPVSVLALFEELGAPRRLSILVEGESLLNDGVGVVVFSALLAIILESGTDPSALFTPEKLGTVGVDIVVASLGGLVVGLTAGYAVFRVMANLDEHMTEIVLTLILAYGSFLLAEHYLHVSGVIATVAAGLFIGNRGAEYAMSPQTKIAVFNTWETAAFLVNTLIFLLIGAKTPVTQLLEHLPLIAAAIVLVVAVRATIVYPFVSLTNWRLETTVPRSYQHVMVWGGLHASIPIALVLGLPPSIPFREELRAMVFGVAAFSLVVQGLSMKRLLDALDIVTRSEEEELYELLVGRARAVDNALDAAEDLRRTGAIPPDVYEQFTGEYEKEKEDLNRTISSLLSSYPEIHREELLIGERQVLKREKSAIMDAMRTGTLSDDVGEQLLEEVDVKLSRVNAGESTVTASPEEEGYEEFWRTKVEEFGLDANPRGSPE